jgi:phytol kinase
MPSDTVHLITHTLRERTLALPVARHPEWARSEVLRKSIHMTVALVPGLAALTGIGPVLALLASGIIVYSYAEFLRAQGRPLAVIGTITVMAARERDLDRPALGPITLALGAMTALLLYPHTAATVAIYTLAFGDGLAGVVGRLFGTIRIPFTDGKTVEGSTAGLVGVFLAVYFVTGNARISAVIAVSATLIELVPTGDLDNLILPVGAGVIANSLMPL